MKRPTSKYKKFFMVGDKVEVVRAGEMYTSYTEMADHLGLKYYSSAAPLSDDTSDEGVYGTVMAQDTHLLNSGDGIVCGVRLHGVKREILIGQKGLRLVRRVDKLPEDLFEI